MEPNPIDLYNKLKKKGLSPEQDKKIQGNANKNCQQQTDPQ